jgi:alpha-N-arabinofuranosidase
VPSSTGAATPATGSANASVRIHAGERVRTLPPEFFGHHLEWVEDAQGLVKPGSGSLDERVVQLLEPIRMPLLRFPGGIMADFYDWKKGVGPQSSRGEIRNPFNKKMETVHFGSPEFIALAKRLGSAACITANYGTGTPQMAGEWAKWFADQGFRPGLWEIGNEIYLAGPRATGPNSKEIFRPGSQYAKDWPAFATAIRGALPDAKVGAIAHLDTGAFPFADGGNPDWTVKMLDALDTKVDFFALHNGYAPVILTESLNLEKESDRQRMYRAMFAGAQQPADNLSSVAREIDRRSPVNAGTPLVITEFGTIVKIPPDLPSIDHTRTMASAVYAASVLDVYMGDPRVSATMFTSPVHKWSSMLVLTDPSGPVTSPAYELYLFYADRFEHGLVQTDIATPTFSSTTLGVVKARSNVPVLMARAGRSTDGRRVTALLVNRAVEGALTTELTFDGFVPTTISCQLLAAPLNATNGPVLSKSVQKAVALKPREMSCAPSATQTLTLPAGSILSVVAER